MAEPPPLPPPPPPPPLPSSGRVRRFVFQMPVLQNVEDVDMYGPGGYYPVNSGDVVGNKFKVIHKLGHGGFALVWLARDLENHRNVAVKVLKDGASDHEVDILEHLRSSTKDHWFTNIREIFKIRGPNGLHQCIVLDLGGPSIQHIASRRKQLPLPFLKEASRNLALALAALHAAGVCHAGKQCFLLNL